MVLSRALSPEDLGAYFIAFSLVSSISLIAVFGLNTSVVKFVASATAHAEFGRAKDAVRLSVALAALFAGILCLVFYFGGGYWLTTNLFHSHALIGMTGLISIWIFLAVMQIVSAESFRGFHQVGSAALINSSNSLALVGLIGLCSVLFTRISLQNVFMLTVGVLGVIVALSQGALWRKVAKLSKEGSLPIGELLRTAAPNGVTNAIYFMLSQFDLWIVGAFKSGSDVAVYGAAAKLVKLVGMPLMIVSLVAPPLVARMHASGQLKELEKVLRSFATIAGWPALLALGVFAFFGKHVLGIVYGGYYSQGAVILLILSLGQIVNVCSGSCGILLAMTGNHRILMFITLFCGALVLFGGLMLVKKHGMEAVAAVSATGLVLQNALMLVAAKRATGVWSHMRFFVHPCSVFSSLKIANETHVIREE